MSDTNGTNGELDAALQDLEHALARASDAAARIRQALPRIERMSTVFDELEAIISASRGGDVPAAAQPAPEPTPARAPRAPRPKQPTPILSEEPAVEPADTPTGGLAEPIETIAAAGGEKLISFRLEFESNPGPLNLRAVDDAISQHPAVRDVALLDYDGRRATLKVWIAPPASPDEVQQSLTARADKIGGDGRHVSVVALEDVA
jgi:hypothetical protein